MSWLGTAARKVVGLFVDAPTLAGGVAVWIAVIGVLGLVAPAAGGPRAVALALGFCSILTLSIVRGVPTK